MSTPTPAQPRLKSTDKLRAYWSRRESDLILFHPLGQGTKSDGALLAHTLGPLVDELKRRGYDPKTVKFSIEPVRGDGRFASQRTGGEAPR